MLIIRTLYILFTWARIWGSVVIFRSQKGYARKNFEKHCSGVPNIGTDETAEAYPWCQSNCNGLNKTFNKDSRGLLWHRRPKFSKYYCDNFLGHGSRTHGMRVQNGTRKYFLGRRHSVMSHFFLFLLPYQRLYIVKNIVYINISVCVEILYELPLLQSNTASETLYTVRDPWEMLTRYLSMSCRPGRDWANTWQWTKCFQSSFQRGSLSYVHIFSFISSSKTS